MRVCMYVCMHVYIGLQPRREAHVWRPHRHSARCVGVQRILRTHAAENAKSIHSMESIRQLTHAGAKSWPCVCSSCSRHILKVSRAIYIQELHARDVPHVVYACGRPRIYSFWSRPIHKCVRSARFKYTSLVKVTKNSAVLTTTTSWIVFRNSLMLLTRMLRNHALNIASRVYLSLLHTFFFLRGAQLLPLDTLRD